MHIFSTLIISKHAPKTEAHFYLLNDFMNLSPPVMIKAPGCATTRSISAVKPAQLCGYYKNQEEFVRKKTKRKGYQQILFIWQNTQEMERGESEGGIENV